MEKHPTLEWTYQPQTTARSPRFTSDRIVVLGCAPVSGFGSALDQFYLHDKAIGMST